MQGLIAKINEYYPLSEETLKLFLPAWKEEDLVKNHVLLRPGAVCKHIYFIKKGGIRSYFLKDDKEITEWIALEDNFFYAPLSYLTNQPGRLWFQTLEPTTLYSIHQDDFDRLCLVLPELERFYRQLLMHLVVACERRIESLMVGTALERYQHLTERCPDIVNRVSLTHIASFLNVTQETLSRIRHAKV